MDDELACPQCTIFAETKGISAAVLKQSIEKDSKKKKDIADEMIEFRSAVAERAWPRESVDFEVSQETRLLEKYRFLPRTTFKEKHGFWPDDARMTCVRVTNSRGTEVSGLLLQTEQNNGAEAMVEVSTARRFIKRTPLLLPSSHKYELQAAQLYQRETLDAGRIFGLKDGSKYRAKKKVMQAYSDEEVQRVVVAHQQQLARSAGQVSMMDRMQTNGEVAVSSSEGSEASELEVGTGDGPDDDPDAGGESVVAVKDNTVAIERSG